MLRDIFISLCLTAASLSAAAQSQTLATFAEVKKLSDGIMASVGAGNYEGAWKQMKPYAVDPSIERTASSRGSCPTSGVTKTSSEATHAESRRSCLSSDSQCQ
jgi:hypothetical protein